MIEYRNGDLLKQKDLYAILHNANAMCTMASGIALSIKQMYPEAYQADLNTKPGDKDKLGTYSVANFEEGSLRKIYNVYGQFRFGREKRQLNYGAFARALWEIKKELPEGVKIGVPYNVGCDRAGGDWNIVSNILEDIFLDSGVTLVICRFRP